MKKSKVLWILSGFLLALILAAAAAYSAGFRYHPDIQQKIFADMVQSNAYKAALANLTADRVLQETAGHSSEDWKYPRTGSMGKRRKRGNQAQTGNQRHEEIRSSVCEWNHGFRQVAVSGIQSPVS